MCPQVKMELRENPKLQAEMIKHLDKWRPFQVGQRPKSKEVSHHPRTGHQEEAMPSTGFSNTRQGAWHFTGPHTCVWSKPMKSSNTNTWSMPKWQNSSLRPLWLPVAYNTWLPTHPTSLCSTMPLPTPSVLPLPATLLFLGYIKQPHFTHSLKYLRS